MTAVNPVDAYARAVVGGKRPAGKYHRLACARHLKDRTREGTRGFPFVFDLARAERFFRFAAQLKHYKGEWAGQRVTLSDSQVFRLGSPFGWVHRETGLRRFRVAYNELPRKQGKSLEAAIVADYVTFFDGEPGAEGYCAATKRDQARIVFNDAKKLVEKSGLKQRIKIHVSNLHRADTSSKLEPLGADHDSTDGLNPHLVIVDEFHAHKNRGLIDVLETAMGARRQPLMFQITTAGNDPLSPCGDQHDYACKILDGVLDDETFFAFIAHADEDDDPFAEKTWKKANPHYGVSVKADDMRALARKAKHMPSALAAFKQKRLNIWVSASTPWLSLEGWKKGQSIWKPELVAGRRCWGGVDLSSKTDLSAVSLVFPPEDDDPKWRLLLWFFTPEDGLEEREIQARAPYRRWVEEQYLTTNPGNRIDQAFILQTLLREIKPYDLQLLGFDPWNIGNLASDLQAELGEGRIVEVPQNMAQLSEPSKEFEALVGSGLVDAAANPVMTWMVSNAVVDRDANDNIRPTKNPKKSRGRIDGLMAAIMGMKLAQMGWEIDEASKDFETRGLFV